ncbi:hypothetical protein GQ53DRAFT_831987 [Thozetella sp. PMI_491]|nr:hypothetical protein GQ53DRAFT_831987 [Thozetella sp. PMI_491]
MDRLSVHAAITGLLVTSNQVINVLDTELDGRRLQTKPIDASQLFLEVIGSRRVLLLLREHIESLAPSPEREESTIQLDQLIQTLTDAVIVFADLEALVLSWKYSKDQTFVKDRAQWAAREAGASKALPELRSINKKMTTMLSILEKQSELGGDAMQRRLFSDITEMLEDRTGFLKRASSISESNYSTLVPSDSVSESHVAIHPSPSMTGSRFRHQLDDDVDTSRPYRQLRREPVDRTSQTSKASSQLSSTAIFSHPSLSNVSILSAAALPISPKDITNNYHHALGVDIVQLATSLPPFERKLMVVNEFSTSKQSKRPNLRSGNRASAILPKAKHHIYSGLWADTVRRNRNTTSLLSRTVSKPQPQPGNLSGMPPAKADTSAINRLQGLARDDFEQLCNDTHAELRRRLVEGSKERVATLRASGIGGALNVGDLLLGQAKDTKKRLASLPPGQFHSFLTDIRCEAERRKRDGKKEQ